MKKENILNLFLMIVIGVLVVVSTVQAATTISTNIVTEGTLSVTGTSTLLGNVGVGTTSPMGKLTVAGSLYLDSNSFLDVITTVASDSNVGGHLYIIPGSVASSIGKSITIKGGASDSNYGGGVLIEGGEGIGLGGGDVLIVGGKSETSSPESAGDVYIYGGENLNTEIRGNTILGITNESVDAGNVGIGTTTPSEKLVVDGNVKITGTTNGVKVYRALLTQTGTNAPVATVLENSLGGTVVWTRSGVGDYRATLTGAFTAAKTFVLCMAIPSGTGAADGSFVKAMRISDNVVQLTTGTDGEMSMTPPEQSIEILVYP